MRIAPSPIRNTFSVIRIAAAAVAVSGALIAGGCGTSGGPVHRTGATDFTSLHQAGATDFTSVHSARQVAQHFYAATGDTLSISPDRLSWDTLSTSSSNQEAFTRYGVFSIYVLHHPDELGVFTSQNGHRLTPDAQGVYWPMTADSSGYWNPVKVYGNVVLSWTTQTRATSGQFRLLDAILSTLGKGVAAVNAKLPASELSCQARGITPTRQAEGTCTQGGVSLTVVNSDHTLHAPGYDIQVTKTKVGDHITSAFNFGTPLFAKGAFLAVALRVANTGTSPLEGVDDAELDVAGRYYSQNYTATDDLSSASTFPLQPGEQGGTVLVFDIPQNVAASALTHGEVVFPGDPNSMVEDATKLDAVRLAGASYDKGPGAAPVAGTKTA